MSSPTITLDNYQTAERVITREVARTGLTVHAIVTVLVSVLLVVINFTLADEFPWSAFAVAGMTIGLLAHWWFGYHNLDTDITARQHKVEERATQLR
jgi:hypothetical protein